MGIVKQFWVKLHTKKRPIAVLHRLNGTSLIGGGRYKIGRQALDFIEM